MEDRGSNEIMETLSEESRESLTPGTGQGGRKRARHFVTGEADGSNAYPTRWGMLVNKYLKECYQSGQKEHEVCVADRTYTVMRREKVTVFYDHDGNALFDVENGRLAEEAGFYAEEQEDAGHADHADRNDDDVFCVTDPDDAWKDEEPSGNNRQAGPVEIPVPAGTDMQLQSEAETAPAENKVQGEPLEAPVLVENNVQDQPLEALVPVENNVQEQPLEAPVSVGNNVQEQPMEVQLPAEKKMQEESVEKQNLKNIGEMACEKLRKGAEKAADRDFMAPVTEYLLKRCMEDRGLAEDVMQEHKTWEKCSRYIYDRARKLAKNNCAMVRDEDVYEWSEDYFHKDDKAEEEKKAGQKKKAPENGKKAEGKKTSGKKSSEKKSSEKKPPAKEALEKHEEAELSQVHGKKAGLPEKEEKTGLLTSGAKQGKNRREIDGQLDMFAMMGLGA